MAPSDITRRFLADSVALLANLRLSLAVFAANRSVRLENSPRRAAFVAKLERQPKGR